MIDFTQFKSVIAVINHFNNEEVCKQTLAEVRWGDDVVCPHCGKHHCVSKDYVQRYIDEQVYRWNTRKESASYRFEDMFKRAAKSFDYTDVLALSSVVSIEHFREYRVMYYNLWKSTHCA